ncbi:magnesium transporter [Desulfolutivibrio sulfoxidireducens]|uniref:magnesium transporter n=1 Tax=Desulfolutivibrio sulfoxidireducens TaxID=2773299 RepID=UPI00159DC7ED|nr:magnesium transporter [Desulfolutivibrio sulfoxidireducens]QLA16868.1 magnesium transporter [Desulfolutivibrio sulfoxidireducens]QLA20434.1 magnesium transporter [Desulfolutivibrio sulfoxidireducens]
MHDTILARLPLAALPRACADLERSVSPDVTELIRAAESGEHPGITAERLCAVRSAVKDVPGDATPGSATLLIRRVLAAVDPQRRAEIFVNLSQDAQIETALAMTRAEATVLVAAMPPDDRVDLLKRIPAECRQAVMPALAHVEREDIRRLSSYAEGTAGAVMTSEYAALNPEMTAEAAIGKLRLEAPDKETIYYAYVLDAARGLLGFVSLKDLILARPESLVSELMNREVIFARADEDQEEVVKKIARYDLLALPVVDERGVLVGIVTHDDAIDVLHQEHTEDMEKFAAITGSHEGQAYLRTSALGHFRNRAFWVVILAALGLVSGFIISSFESTLANLLILTLYMPMIAAAGGNVGSQSATVVIRALTLGHIRPRDALRVFLKEFQVAALLGGILAILTFAKVSFLSHGTVLPEGVTLAKVGLVVGLALCAQVITATILGAALPILAVRLGRDPAVAASPSLTTLVDITGLLLYFGAAKVILGV